MLTFAFEGVIVMCCQQNMLDFQYGQDDQISGVWALQKEKFGQSKAYLPVFGALKFHKIQIVLKIFFSNESNLRKKVGKTDCAV